MKVRASWWAIAAGALWAVAAQGTVSCHALFSDGMVLQRGRRVPIWGRADAGEQVTVQFQGQVVAVAAEGGRWQAWLAPLAPGGPDNLVIAGARNTLIIRDVLVGDVWLCAGQSNMAISLSLCEGGPQAAAAANDANLRLLTVPRDYHSSPRRDLPTRWLAARPETAADFSGLGYFFGRQMAASQEVPIGLINASYGGTGIESWMSAEALRRAGIAEILELYARGRQAFPSLARRAQELLAEWRQQAMAAQMAGKLPPAAPEEDAKRVPTVLHNAMVAPLTPFGLAGVLWYQGESNASQPQYYRALLTALIRDWREQWGQPELPFLFVQLPGYDAPGVLPDSWALVREAQLAVSLTEPAVAMVVTADLGEADNLHPRRKEPIAERLALAARALVHGEEIESSGPVYQTMSSDGRRLRIKFDHVTGGLQAAGGTVQGFTIAGADGQFLPALATIEGDGVWLWNLKIEHPVAARYGWGNVPNGNLYNGAGLPASPFRTDDLRGEQGPAR